MRHYILTALFTLISSIAAGQSAYFVDGYHGGIYGHYPVSWKTQFLVDKLAEHPQWKICIEIEPETWDTVKLKTPVAYENFKRIVTDKRVEFTNPTYAQPYCYNVSGESIIRQFEYGIRDINRHFPEVKFETYSVEEPCFTSSLPQILNSFGFKYAVLKCPNTCWGGYTRAYGGELVNWIGPDGSSILTVPRYECEELEKNSTWQTTAWGNKSDYLDACFAYGIKHPVGMCFQDAGWNYGPWLSHVKSEESSSIYVTWKEYFENISEGSTEQDYRMPQEDVLVNLMWGSQILQKIAQQVRKSENIVTQAEKMGVLANISNGYRYDQKLLDEAWRTLMLAQHHDSWIVPYNGLNNGRTWAEEIALWTAGTDEISQDVIGSAVSSFNTSKSTEESRNGYIRVFNTLGVARNEITRVAIPREYNGFEVTVRAVDGKKIDALTQTEGEKVSIVFKADVPAFGFTTYRIEGKKTSKNKRHKAAPPVVGGDYVVENDMYRVVFDAAKGGTIKSLRAKKEGNREFVDKTSEYSLGEIRGHFYEDNRFYSSTEKPAEITVLKNDGQQSVILIKGEIASHPFTQRVTLAQGQRRIDFDLTIDWKESVGIGEYAQTPEESWAANRRAWSDDRFKLNVLFPVNLDSPTLYKDAPFDVCESQLESTAFNRWDSIKHNVILNWVSLGETKGGHGFSLFSDHTTSYSYAPDFPLALTLQYSGHGLWSRNYDIAGPTNVKYAILPHAGSWETASISNENIRWAEPLVAAYDRNGTMESRSFIDLSDTGYQLSAAHLTDEGVLVRLFNADGDETPRNIKFGFKIDSIDEVSLAGEVIQRKELTANGGMDGITVSMPRFGFKTFIINRYVKTSQ